MVWDASYGDFSEKYETKWPEFIEASENVKSRHRGAEMKSIRYLLKILSSPNSVVAFLTQHVKHNAKIFREILTNNNLEFKERPGVFHFKNGSKLLILPPKAEKIRGFELKGIYTDDTSICSPDEWNAFESRVKNEPTS